MDPNSEQKLKEKLEKEGMKKVEEIIQNNNSPSCKTPSTTLLKQNCFVSSDLGAKCLNIIQEGSKEFEKETGRKMTYIEMRDLYG